MAETYFKGGTTDHETEWNQAGNWTNGLPASGDTAGILPNCDYDLAGYDASSILLAKFIVPAGYGGQIASADTPLHIDADEVLLNGEGQAFVQIDNSTTVKVLQAAGAGNGEFGLHLTGSGNALLLIAANAAASIGIAGLLGESAAFTVVKIEGGQVSIGEGATVTNLYVSGRAKVVNWEDLALANVDGRAELQIHGSAAIDLLQTAQDAVVYYYSNGTLGEGQIKGRSTLDASVGFGFTATALHLYEQCNYHDPNGEVTYTNGIDLHGRLGDDGITAELPRDKKLTLAALS